jgi:two-component system cell cycle sensor histidine kinase/response regulator CckA
VHGNPRLKKKGRKTLATSAREASGEPIPGSALQLARSKAQQISRMEAIGQLAGGIAHDFNNLLTVILGHSEFLLRRNESPKQVRSRVDEIRKAAERGAWLTNQLLAFSRNQLLKPMVLQINSVLENMEGILRRVLGEDVALRMLRDPNLSWVKVDVGQLQQIVLNLAGNARDAMPQGGRLLIETLNLSISGNEAMPQSYIAPGDYAALIVRDTGNGIDAETRARIFEPFFTTKEKGKGTGLGLATVYGIVKQSGGYIWVESELGRGSSFYTLLPCVPEPSRSVTVQKVLNFRSGGETVLLVEDDPGVRTMSAEVLRKAGYHVLVAPSAADALHLAEKHKGQLDLLLTDVVMPRMTGPELADRFALLFPRVHVLYMTGYTDDAIVNRGLQGRTRHVLQKPFTHETLAGRVREALEFARHH